MVFIFDTNSHFGRTYSVQAKDGIIPTYEGAFRNGVPVFCMRPLLNLVRNEIKALKSLNLIPTHVVLVFDHKGQNFRHELFPGYKGTRPVKAPEWVIQEDMMFQMFKDEGFACLREPNVEADDVICTLTTKLSKLGIKSVVSTGDKDMAALCDENTLLYNGKMKKLFDPMQIKEHYGVEPGKIVDLLTLIGDKVDSIEGVKNAGKQSAISMLEHYTVDEYLEDPALIHNVGIPRTAKRIEQSLINDVEQIRLTQKLVKMKDDVSIPLNLNDMRV